MGVSSMNEAFVQKDPVPAYCQSDESCPLIMCMSCWDVNSFHQLRMQLMPGTCAAHARNCSSNCQSAIEHWMELWGHNTKEAADAARGIQSCVHARPAAQYFEGRVHMEKPGLLKIC